MPERLIKKYRIMVDRVNDIIGADLVRDAIKIILTAQDQDVSVVDSLVRAYLEAISTRVDKNLSDVDSDIVTPLSAIRSHLLAKLDIALSQLRDYLAGTGNKTLTDIVNELTSILAQLDVALSTRASETTLSDVSSKLTQPTQLKSAKVTIDNSGGSTDLVQPLFSSSTPSRYAIIKRDESDTDTIYIGDPSSQEFPFKAGDSFETMVSDLSIVYIKVPVGVVANLYVLYEV